MEPGSLARRKGSGWIIALPPEVRRHLGVTHRVRLHWHLWRRGEVVLSLRAGRQGGRPEVTRLTRELDEARAVIAELRGRHESADRTWYAQGYADGAVETNERLMHPHGPAGERVRRRRLYRWAWPKADTPRPSAERVPAPVLETPSPSAPSPSDSSGGAGTSGGEATQVPHHDEPGAGTAPGTT